MENLNKKVLSANSVVAGIAYAFSEVICVYPITPSTEMSEKADKLAFKGKKNLFGEVAEVFESHSEVGSAGIIHGALTCGSLATTFTCSQGLLLMIPEMYRIAGEFLPAVIHVASRSLVRHALSIFCDHSDVYACRQTGFSIICSSSVQESADFAVLAHLCAIASRSPFLHFFDGFRTSNEIQKIRTWDYEGLKELFDEKALENFRGNSLSPSKLLLKGTNQNDDVFFEFCEASNKRIEETANVITEYIKKINLRTNSNYAPFMYCGDKKAERIIVAMGSICGAIEETVDFLLSKGEKIGFVKVCVYRPFLSDFFNEILPQTVKKISVLDRTKESGSVGEPLFLDVIASISELKTKKIEIFNGRFGTKDIDLGNILSVFDNMKLDSPKKKFTIGINDDVTYLSLEKNLSFNFANKDCYSVLIYGFASDGSVTSARNIAEIIGENTNLNVQCYSKHDSKKSGGVTVSHLRFSNNEIKSSYCIEKADFVVCNNFYYIYDLNLTSHMKKKSIFLLNCIYEEEELLNKLPEFFIKFIIENEIEFYVSNAYKIAEECNLGRFINTVMQTAFLKILPIFNEKNINNLVKESIKRNYAKKGEKTIESNFNAVDKTSYKLVQLKIDPNMLNNFNKFKTKNYKVSDFINHIDGSVPVGTSCLRKNFNDNKIPKWISQNCIQCNICSLICPHAVIRPFVLDKDEIRNAPEGFDHLKMRGIDNLDFAISIASDHCTGCELCVRECPGKMGKKALVMSENKTDMKYFNYANSLTEKKEILKIFPKTEIKGSQFRRPLLEFSCACPGCGQTAYVKLLTQLFGEALYISNATGCSSIWGGAFGEIPYCSNQNFAPVWQNSLFEDAAEFGFGMFLSQKKQKGKKSFWIIGGDGWAYDIGFGGLDHVLASGENINILVLDTEIYSNTGGQQSKSTPKGAAVPFSLGGKKIPKKNLAKMLMTYRNVYVSQVAMGANHAQCLKAFLEAESYNGPSIIVAYSPCIGHGIKGGMSNSLNSSRLAVACGCWKLFRFNPELENSFIDDSPNENKNSDDYRKNERRFNDI
jgi:pyruvate-ferredoxin/flavodoxin oxidoreductase